MTERGGGRNRGAAVRAEAAMAVHAVVSEGKSLDAALSVAESRIADRIGTRDRAFLRALAYGTIRHHWRLVAAASGALDRPLKSRDRIIMALLAVGIYQLTDLRTASHAAVSATVEAARLLGRTKMKSLVNAVLRNVQRAGQGTELASPADDEVRFDHPRWLIEQLKSDWPDDWQRLLEANNERAPMWLRVNRKRLTTAAYSERLTQAGIASEPADGLDVALRLAEPANVDALPGFAAGDVSVQDAAAQLAAPWLLAGLKSDSPVRILDACAAPGGKTGQLLELAPPNATLTAVEAEERRTIQVRDTLERLGEVATVSVGDASQPEAWWDSQPFDRILLDAPCSASGVIRRHPDIKHLRRRADIGRLAALQSKLLAACWSMLAPGGRLIYVTCSVLREENDAVVAKFLSARGEHEVVSVLPNNNIHDLMVPTRCGFQVLPGTGGMDGFYFACLERHV